ncbi:transcriptional regulator, AbrB family [Thiorhodovibrio winogradskyi]|uniref:Transcriptional regulator, AbrB family n=1 Tax=Thiorhodovibrio winogradskyi TaxID=77007 RepID=A0ABZ0S7K1_9GAMM|nr:AbrB/MazE/SpoVT family DNA-binding domain-containing protein [Thiorhodovibrio winogradskyi]
MSTMTLSAKRQVVLPSALCRQLALTPGTQVEVQLAPDGGSIIIAPVRKGGKKPATVLFNRAIHRGKPVVIEDMDAAVVAARLAQSEAYPKAS